jgi:N-acetyl-gamma-glutamyl-phosphate reductase
MTTDHHRKISCAVIGASGYTGVELVRLLLRHPNVELAATTSRQYAGKSLADIYPAFAGKTALKFSLPNVTKFAKHLQAAFLCLPHHDAMGTARRLRDHGVKVIDLSADFRFSSVKTYEKTYGPHSQKGLLKTAVYGLPEIFGEDVRKANLVGAPGCYVTSALLALAPLVQNQLVTLDGIVCDSKSGVSGAGRKESLELMAAELHGNFKAYGIGSHRHRPEIEEKLSQLAGRSARIVFTPHLLPVSRGILSTVYAQPVRKWQDEALARVYEKFYRRSPFVKILKGGKSPQIKSVVGTNDCHISAHYDAHAEKIIVISALDNLLKGASGQAVQCFNLMYGFPEDAGLTQIALNP